MAVKEISNVNVLKSINLSNIDMLKYDGLVYWKIRIVDEKITTIFFYNSMERHLIKIIQPNYLWISYIILQKVEGSQNIYKINKSDMEEIK